MAYPLRGDLLLSTVTWLTDTRACVSYHDVWGNSSFDLLLLRGYRPRMPGRKKEACHVTPSAAGPTAPSSSADSGRGMTTSSSRRPPPCRLPGRRCHSLHGFSKARASRETTITNHSAGPYPPGPRSTNRHPNIGAEPPIQCLWRDRQGFSAGRHPHTRRLDHPGRRPARLIRSASGSRRNRAGYRSSPSRMYVRYMGHIRCGMAATPRQCKAVTHCGPAPIL